MVTTGELVHRLTGSQAALTIFHLINAGPDVPFIRDAFARDEMPLSSEAVQALYVPVHDATGPASKASGGVFDASTCFSRDLARSGLYPAIDPLRSTSRLLTPDVVGQEHCEVALGVRQLIQSHKDLLHASASAFGPYSKPLSDEDELLMSRARKAQRLLTQPLYVAEPWTSTPGQSVSREQTVADFKALLSGEYDHLSEDAFLYRGALADPAR